MTAEGLVYDPVTHTSVKDGRPVPHVTDVLSAVGVATDFQEIAAMSGGRAENIAIARARGTAVHLDCHAYDDNDLDWPSVDERVRPYVEAWARFREMKDLRIVTRERQVFSPYWYTGFFDAIVETVHPFRRVLIDIKTGDPEDAAADLQTAAYANAYNGFAAKDEKVSERWAVWLQPWKKVPFRVFNYSSIAEYPDSAMHYSKFLACLTVYNERLRRGRLES